MNNLRILEFTVWFLVFLIYIYKYTSVKHICNVCKTQYVMYIVKYRIDNIWYMTYNNICRIQDWYKIA